MEWGPPKPLYCLRRVLYAVTVDITLILLLHIHSLTKWSDRHRNEQIWVVSNTSLNFLVIIPLGLNCEERKNSNNLPHLLHTPINLPHLHSVCNMEAQAGECKDVQTPPLHLQLNIQGMWKQQKWKKVRGSGKKDGLVQAAWCPGNVQTLRCRCQERAWKLLKQSQVATVFFSSPPQALYSSLCNQFNK